MTSNYANTLRSLSTPLPPSNGIRALGRALDKAEKGTWQHRTAWLMAEDATRELGKLGDVCWRPST